jgi:hypothetical protein
VQAEVFPDSAWWARIAAAWKQFDRDLAAYEPRAAEPPKPTGRAPESLPALRIEITGAVTASNLAEFRATALGAIRSVNRELTTDQHFSDAEQAVKWCSEVESRIKAAKEHALSQTASIDALFKTLDEVSAEAKRVRLDLEKLVDRRKTEVKGEMVAAAKAAYDRHETALRQEAGGWINLPAPDFGGAIKGKRSVSAMQDALDVTLANAKIAADESARRIRAALAALDEEAAGYTHLFADRLTFIGKAPEDVRLLVQARIAAHKAAEERRAEELAEKQRERIRAEEAAKLAREQQEREAAEAQARQQAQAAAPAPTPAAVPVASPAPVSHAAAVVPMPARAPAAAEPPTLTLGAMCERLGFTMNRDFVRQLGFPGTAGERGSVKWTEREFALVCEALVAHVRTVAARELEAA